VSTFLTHPQSNPSKSLVRSYYGPIPITEISNAKVRGIEKCPFLGQGESRLGNAEFGRFPKNPPSPTSTEILFPSQSKA